MSTEANTKVGSIAVEAALKFTRFKQFIADKAPPSALVHIFLTLSLSQLLNILRPNKNKTTDELLTSILIYAGLTGEQFAVEDVITAKLYLEYFVWVIEQTD